MMKKAKKEKNTERSIKSPEDALSFAMSELKGPYGIDSEENKILARDPLICLYYVRYVLSPNHPIPDIIMGSIMSDPDVYFIYVSTSKNTRKLYDRVNKIINIPL